MMPEDLDLREPSPVTLSSMPMISAKELVVRYGSFEAVKGVSFDVMEGECLGVVGESGSGKSSLAKALIGLNRVSGGHLALRRDVQGRMQMIFQDAVGSLNPRKTVGNALIEALTVSPSAECPRGTQATRAVELLGMVGLPADVMRAFPNELSGGQCQRLSIARCLAVRPKVLIADEPVSALDVSVQARILNLLVSLQQQLGLTLVLISHDLAVVRTVCHRVLVMRKGEVVESGNAKDLFQAPAHPYTVELLRAVPDVARALATRGTTGI